MIIIYDKQLNNNKSLNKELNKIYGLSDLRISKIVAKLGFFNNMTVNQSVNHLKKNFIQTIYDIINKRLKLSVEARLRYINTVNSKKLKELGNYKTIRHIQCLPVNGQRTHSNAKTQKKKRGNQT
jgi:small subunit ribosomal protein S13